MPELRVILGGRDTAGMPPPHNVELEEDFLGMLLFADVRAEIAKARGLGLQPECFFADATSRIWQAMCALADAPGSDVGIVAIGEWLRARNWIAKVGGTAYLTKLADSSPAGCHRLRGHAKRIIALWRLRQLQATAHRIAAEIYFDVGEPEEYLVRTTRTLIESSQVRTIGAAKPFRETLRASWEALDAPPGTRGGYQTGLERFDAQVGGLHRSEVLLVSGKEKSGKSILVGQWCADVASQQRTVTLEDGTTQQRRYGSLIFSLDAAKITDWAERVASAEACVDLEAFRVGRATETDREAFAKAIERVSEIPCYVDGEHVSTVGQMGARIRAVRDEMAAEGVDLAIVAIDYIQLAQGEGQNREQQIGNAMRGVISLASQEDLRGIAWVVISQTNSEGEVAQCRALAQMCDGWIHLSVDDDKPVDQGWQHARGWISCPVYPARLEVKRGRRFAMGARAKPIPLWCCYRYTFFFCSRDDG